MPCYHPVTGYRSRVTSKNGKRPLVFSTTEGYPDLRVEIPCGRCIGCRLEYSRQWAMRCMHEASLYDNNCSITLTYDNENLPNDFSLNKRHFQLFMKSLRKKYAPKKIRFYHCGEYGEENYRPHYHAIIFNHNFTDLDVLPSSSNNTLYTSPTLTDIWGKGLTQVGTVTFESAAYVARYITKKSQANLPRHTISACTQRLANNLALNRNIQLCLDVPVSGATGTPSINLKSTHQMR